MQQPSDMHKTPCPSSDAAPPAPSSVSDASIVIVGAGPVGLLAAAMLYQRGARRITVLERASDPTAINPSRTYRFAVTRRGHRVLSACPRLVPRLRAAGVVTPLIHATHLWPDGSVTEFSTPPPADGMPYHFLRRPDFVAAMLEYLEAECPGVTVLPDTPLHAMTFNVDGSITLNVRDGTGNASGTLRAALVLACDGARSTVLEELRAAHWIPSLRSTHGFNERSFDIYSSRLRVKSIMLRNETAKVVAAAAQKSGLVEIPDHSLGYSLFGAGDPPFNMSCSKVPPCASEAVATTTCMVSGLPDAPVLAARDVDEAYGIFQRNFPQIVVRDCISEEAMRDFVEAGSGWAFGSVRRTKSLVGIVGDRATGAVIMLGDAAQSAPPDLGQGLNSGLEDVGALMWVIDQAAGDATLGKIARAYERLREPDIEGLMYFNWCSAKWQVQRGNDPVVKLWLLAMRMRSRLASWFPTVFHPPMNRMLQQAISYGEMQRRARETTIRICAGIFMVVGAAGAAGAFVVSRRGSLPSFASLRSKGLADAIRFHSSVHS